jgi:hypothetical protein
MPTRATTSSIRSDEPRPGKSPAFFVNVIAAKAAVALASRNHFSSVRWFYRGRLFVT